MTRWLAGVFGLSPACDRARLAAALAPHRATIVSSGALHVAHSGLLSRARECLCLLDGFLDNAAELSAELELPPTSSHEELLARAWWRWGRALPARLRGDFMLLVWDRERGEGLLARDQLGARALFLHDASGAVRFASEIRHLLALLPQRPAPDPVSLAHWLALSDRPGPATLYEGIRRLNPGAMLLLGRGGAREERYWTPRFSGPLSCPQEQLAQELRAGLVRAVQRRVDRDSATAVLMSGGLDSACVAALAAAHAPGRVSAYSAVFPAHPAVDESALIYELRDSLRLPGTTAKVRPGGLLASAQDAIGSWGVPLRSWGDFWASPLLRAAAAAGARVVLGGEGGDELFAVRAHLLADRLRGGHPLQAIALARELPGAGERPPRRELLGILAAVGLAGALPYGPHEALRRRLAYPRTPSWLLPGVVGDLLDSADPLAWKRLDGPRWWAEAAHALTRGVEEAGVLEHQRRRAASAGLEARHPLLDFDLVALALRLPPVVSFNRHHNRPLLRESMLGMLPDSVRLRAGKARFESLVADCLAGPDDAAVRRLLSDPAAEIHAYVDGRELQRALLGSDGRRALGPFRWMWHVWRLTTAECWLRAQADPNDQALLRPAEASSAQITLEPTPWPSHTFFRLDGRRGSRKLAAAV